MKRLLLLLIMTLVTFLLSACDQSGFVTVGLVTEGTHSLGRGDTIHGPLIISGGEMFLESGSLINGAVYMLGGELLIDGEISGDISFIAGSLNLGPNAVIQGDLNVGGTELTQSPDATILGALNRGSGIQMPSIPETQGPSLGEQLVRSLVEGLILAVLAYVLVRYQQKPLKRVSDAVSQHPVISLAMGLLVAIIGISLLITIAFTILLIPISLLGLTVFGIAIVFGLIACGVAGADIIKHRLKLNLQPRMNAFLGVFFLMAFIILISRLSGVGSLLLILTSSLGLGAVFLTRFGLRDFEPATDWDEG